MSDRPMSVRALRADELEVGMLSLGGFVRDVTRWHGSVVVLWETGTVTAYEPDRQLNAADDARTEAMTDRSDEWAIATDSVEPARMEPGTKMYGIAQAGAMHAVVFTEFKGLADRIVDLLNQAAASSPLVPSETRDTHQ